jgi:large subunit ribosomal protein L3
MKFILGKKINMTQFFDEDGKVFPATLVDAGPIKVVQRKTVEQDGYEAIQFGYGEVKEARVNKAAKGHFKDLGNYRHLKEYRLKGPESSDLKVGDTLDAGVFTAGDTVVVTGVSKGKGFQGVVKRHGFKGGRRSHGQKHSEREPGTISGGGGRAGGRVAKGLRMGGRMGGDIVTVKNLKVLAIDTENSKILVKGAIPGRRGTLVTIIG